MIRQGKPAEGGTAAVVWLGRDESPRSQIPELGYNRLHEIGNAVAKIERAKGKIAEAEAITKSLPRELIPKTPTPSAQ